MKKLCCLALLIVSYTTFAGNVLSMPGQSKKKSLPPSLNLQIPNPIKECAQHARHFINNHRVLALVTGISLVTIPTTLLIIRRTRRNPSPLVLSLLNQNEETEEKTECKKCNQLSKISEFILYCKSCNAKICETCDVGLALEGELFLDKRADYFFVKSNCFNCQREVRSYGTGFGNETRYAILMDRAHTSNDPYEEVRIGLKGNFTY